LQKKKAEKGKELAREGKKRFGKGKRKIRAERGTGIGVLREEGMKLQGNHKKNRIKVIWGMDFKD